MFILNIEALHYSIIKMSMFELERFNIQYCQSMFYFVVFLFLFW